MHFTIAILCVAGSQFSGELLTLLTPVDYRYTGGGYSDREFHYRLYRATPSDTESLPLIVWLHGLGEAGDDNMKHLRWLDRLIFRRPWERDRYPFFLLAVQCPSDNRTWTREPDSAAEDDMINVTRAILDQVLRDYPIDRSRVYLTGLSSGGSGCWALGIRYPEYFAAVAPIASRGGDDSQVMRLAKIPVWAFHCTADGRTPVLPVATTVKTLIGAGGNACLTQIESNSHDAWTAAFEQYHLLDWLLAQRRGQTSSSPAPGTIALRSRLQDFANGWQWWQILLQVAVPTTLIVAIAKVVKQRRQAIARSRLASSSTSHVDSRH